MERLGRGPHILSRCVNVFIGTTDPSFLFSLALDCMQRDIAWHGNEYGVLHLLAFGIAIGAAWLFIYFYSSCSRQLGRLSIVL